MRGETEVRWWQGADGEGSTYFAVVEEEQVSQNSVWKRL